MDKDITKRRARQLRRKQEFARENPVHHVYMNARRRARENGIAFDIEESDIFIPKRCPILGIKLKTKSGNRDQAPTLDRIIPSLGYVKGNIAVMSFRANRIKNDATMEEILALAHWFKAMI